MYPYPNDIGQRKVSEALPQLEFLAADYNFNFTLLPNIQIGTKKFLFLSLGNPEKIMIRIIRNSEKNN